MTRLLAAVLLAAAACSGAGPGRSAATARESPMAPIPARQVWERLVRSLPGSWRATTGDGATISMDFRLVSGGSALVESFRTPSGAETLTVYHPDGDGLMLTHYCAQGNQPRLRVVEVTGDLAVFRQFDATNVAPDQALLVERTLRVSGDRLDLTETYRQPDGTTETTVLLATRVPST